LDDYEAELKKLEKELKIEDVKVKDKIAAKKVDEKEKAEKVKKKAKKGSWFSRFKKDYLRTTPKRGQPDIPIDEDISKTVVNLPFDYWAGTRHELWKLNEDEETKLSKAFQKALGPYIPYILKQFFPAIAFGALFFRIVETKRKQEAKLALANRLEEFSPRRRKKILKHLQKQKKVVAQ